MSDFEAGWYPNPENRKQQRYWDGERWTDKTRDLSVFDRAAGAGIGHAPPPPGRGPGTEEGEAASNAPLSPQDRTLNMILVELRSIRFRLGVLVFFFVLLPVTIGLAAGLAVGFK